MKKLLFAITLLFPMSGFAGIYTNTGSFRPYISLDTGLNIADYTIKTDISEQYYSATINAGARIGANFGLEFFFTHSGNNNLELTSTFETINHEVYYMGYGFDIYGYYRISPEFDFFTTFGVANYNFYDEYDYINTFESSSDKISENQVSTRLGIGFMFTFPNDNVSALFQYQYTPINMDIIRNLNEFSIGVRYTF